MSALDFLGGLAGTYSSIDKGIKDAEDRDQLKKDREYQAQTRQYELGQQKRKVEEQARADKMREADAAVSTTEQVTTPESKAIYGNDAAVTRDDEGNLMPGAIEKPATTVTRNRSMYDVFRDYAKNRRDAGDATGALDFQTKAIKVATDQASRQATGLIGQSAGMSLEQYAQGAVKLFNNDALPQSIRDVKTNADGSVTATIFHNDTNQSMPVTFKTKAELTNAIRSQYQPEVYGKLLEKQAEVEAEIAKNPYHNATPGTVALDKRTGKPVYTNPTDREITGYDASGQPIYGKGPAAGRSTGAGAGTREKPVDPLKATTDAVEFAIDKSAAKGALEPSVVARANTMGRQLAASAQADGRGLDPSVAAELAINAATGKTPITPAFNPRTGTIDNVVEYQGNKFSVEGLGKPGNARLDGKQLSSVAMSYVNSLPEEQRSQVVAAAYNKDELAKLNTSLEQRARSPEAIAALTQRLGREPTEDDIKSVVKATQDAVRPGLELISRYATLTDDGKSFTKSIAQKAGYKSDFSGVAEKKAPPAKTDVGGMDSKKYSGLSGSDLSRALNADTQKMVAANRGNAERLAAARNSANTDPEILALETKRSNALRAGKPYDANAAIDQIEKIRKERYGL